MIRLRDVQKSFGAAENAAPVLSVRSLVVARGERVALMGESGSGKTTILNLVGGLLTPDAGSVEVAGSDLATLSEAARDRFRARHVGYLFQTFHLLDGWTARENVELGASFTGRRAEAGRAEALLREVGLGERLGHWPRQLSVGQQARVALARALINKPEVLLADEPTGALDHANGATVLRTILDSARVAGSTVLCATHDPEVAAAFDRVVRVEDLR
ncbi:MAG: ABC transporter ATP-binding protein [Planctomycetota bacterium]|nr:ABC transporter ATP-binding protein [Planctomycetota bacterium]